MMNKQSELVEIVNNFLKDEKASWCLKDEACNIDNKATLICYDWMYDVCKKNTSTDIR